MRAPGIVGLMLGFALACSSEPAPPAGSAITREECQDQPDGVLCTAQGEALTCRANEAVEAIDCAPLGQVCSASGGGCVACRAGERSCDGNDLIECRADGSGTELIEACEAGLSCSPQGCRDLCAQAEKDRSYIGCEYFPVFTSNSTLDSLFRPAVVIANPNLVPAQVSVERAGQRVAEAEVRAEGIETVMLGHIAPLRSPTGSGIVRGGAYHLVSSVPVTVHQFNPLLFEIDQSCEAARPGSEEATRPSCYSLSNDASLLLPAHVLAKPDGEGTDYLVVTRPSLWNQMNDGVRPVQTSVSPGFVAIVGAGRDPVRVRIKSSAHTQGAPLATVSPAGATEQAAEVEGVEALAPGDRLDGITLGPGDVLQLLSSGPATCGEEPVATRRPGEQACKLGPEYDLTGTEIEADGPIAVIGGHNCSYVPFDRIACDHLEESMFPLETWSTEVVVARPRAGEALPQVVRVVSALDDNRVRFEPDVAPPVTLGRGESFELVTTEHLVVRADKPITVAQFLVGQNGEPRVGDPSMTIAIPSVQFRTSYTFLSPETYDLNYVSLIARAGDRVVLDGAEVTSFEPIGESGFQVASVRLVRAGSHQVESLGGLGVGVQIYGYGAYTSYMLPGGLDLKVIGMVW